MKLSSSSDEFDMGAARGALISRLKDSNPLRQLTETQTRRETSALSSLLMGCILS
jgi:hypothetical protein